MIRICKNCIYWERDWGIHCFNGWTDVDRDDGRCHCEPRRIYKEGEEITCSKFK